MTSITQKKVFAALPRTERARAVRITGDPMGNNFLYCNGNSVYIRNLKDPLKVDIYTEHSKPTSIARYSPSGFYIASGDKGGKVRIWDTTNEKHILKSEFQVLTGELRDIAWSPDSQKIAICGEGRDKYGAVITFDSGNTVGEITSHTKSINCISYRPERPFRIVTAGEDFLVNFFEGPPFKCKGYCKEHANFVNVARFSPSGQYFISGDSNGKLFRRCGKTSEDCTEICDGKRAHNGGIYEVCFRQRKESQDGKDERDETEEFVTASGDKTVKIFNVNGERSVVFNMDQHAGKLWQDMQLGALWQKDEILTVNGFGHITYLDPSNPPKPKRVIKGHQKPITTLALALIKDKKVVFTGGQEGIVAWDVESGECDNVKGKGHADGVMIPGMVVSGDSLISVATDDHLVVASVSDKAFTDVRVKMDSQPTGLDIHNGVVIVACVNHIVVVDEGGVAVKSKGARGDAGPKKEFDHPVKGGPVSFSRPDDDTMPVKGGPVSFSRPDDDTMPVKGGPVSFSRPVDDTMPVGLKGGVPVQSGGACADAGLKKRFAFPVKGDPVSGDGDPVSVSIKPDDGTIAVGFKENQIRIYSLENCRLNEKQVIKVDGEVTSLAFSPDSKYLAYSSNKKVGVYSTSEYGKPLGRESEKHTARVMCMGWSPNSQWFATSSLDSFLIVHKADMSGEKPSIKAHSHSHINELAWVDDCTIITAGQDSNVKQFTVHF